MRVVAFRPIIEKVEPTGPTSCRDLAVVSKDRSRSMSDRFDEFTKHLGAQDDRRGLLRAAAAGSLGLLGLTALQDDATAGPLSAASNRDCRNNNDCGKNQQCVKKGTKDKKCKNNTKRCKCKKK
jgi:hypothetical protein